METVADARRLSVFPMGEYNEQFGIQFTGKSYLAQLLTEPVPTFHITFEPGSRTDWHIHRASSGGGHILICTAGRGWYQIEGEQPRAMKAGDTVAIGANVKHWHGAASDSWFQHIAQDIPGENAGIEWCEKVSDGEYPGNE